MLESPLVSLAVAALFLAFAAGISQAEDGLAALTGDESPLRDGDRIVFFGDSITEQGASEHGYVTRIREAIEENQPNTDVAVINRGISGHKVPDLQERLDRHVLAENPTAVFIYIGINDVWHEQMFGTGTPKDAFEAGLRDIIEQIREAGAVVVLATPSVIGEKSDDSNELDPMLDEYADISRKIAADMEVELCDLREAFVDHLKAHNDEQAEQGVLTMDGVHLNRAGNALVADRAAASLAQALGDRD